MAYALVFFRISTLSRVFSNFDSQYVAPCLSWSDIDPIDDISASRSAISTTLVWQKRALWRKRACILAHSHLHAVQKRGGAPTKFSFKDFRLSGLITSLKEGGGSTKR